MQIQPQGQPGGPLVGSCGSGTRLKGTGWGKGVQGLAVQAWVPLVIVLPMPCLAHGLWCQDCTLANSSHCAPKQCQPTDTVCASVRITDPSSSKTGPGEDTGATERQMWGEVRGVF